MVEYVAGVDNAVVDEAFDFCTQHATQYPIEVRNFSGDHICDITVQPSTTLADAKAQIATRCGVAVPLQRLLRGDQELQGDETVLGCDVGAITLVKSDARRQLAADAAKGLQSKRIERVQKAFETLASLDDGAAEVLESMVETAAGGDGVTETQKRERRKAVDHVVESIGRAGEAVLDCHLPMLVGLLRGESSQLVHAAVCDVLGTLGSAGAVYAPDVAACLGHTEKNIFSVRFQSDHVAACEALWRFGPEVANAYKGQMLSEESEVADLCGFLGRFAQRGSEGEQHAKQAAAWLGGLLGDPRSHSAACRALADLGPVAAQPYIDQMLETDQNSEVILRDLSNWKDADVLARALFHREAAFRRDACARLAALGPLVSNPVAASIAGLLQDPDAAVQIAAFEALLECRRLDPGLAGRVGAFLRSARLQPLQPHQRDAACRLLVGMRASAELETCLAHGGSGLKRQACVGLGQLGADAAPCKPALERACASDESLYVRGLGVVRVAAAATEALRAISAAQRGDA